MLTAARPLTQLAPTDGEILLQYDPLLDLLGVGRCSSVDPFDPLLDGFVDGRHLVGYDLGHLGRRDAMLLAEVQHLRAQLVRGVAVVVLDAL